MSEVDKTPTQATSNLDSTQCSLFTREMLWAEVESLRDALRRVDELMVRERQRHKGYVSEARRAIHKALSGKHSAPETSRDAEDARRYRWLKAEDRKPMPLGTISWRNLGNMPCKLGDHEDLDKFIDAAMAASPGASVTDIYLAAVGSSPVKASPKPTVGWDPCGGDGSEGQDYG